MTDKYSAVFRAIYTAARLTWWGQARWARLVILTLGLTMARAVDAPRAEPQDSSRLVAIGGTVTEIVYALGAGSRLVGVDTSSTYPTAATQLPQVGYQRSVSVEGVLALKPTLVLATAEAGPPTALRQLQMAGTPVLTVPATYTVEGVQGKIRLMARALGLEAQGEQLVQALLQDMAVATSALQQVRSHPTVLFIYARGQGALNVAGRNTAAAAMIALAGGRHAVTGYEGYRPFTAEAIIAAAPDLLLLPARGLESLGGAEALLHVPGIALTPAGQQRRIVALDDLYLLGFGPRTGQAVRDLIALLHPELERPRP